MDYRSEKLIADLKQARERKGLSQRQLSTLVGVPQSHISKIESNAVDMRISSCLAIAHATDSELMIVPRKAMPAVQNIIRSVAPYPTAVSATVPPSQKAVQESPKPIYRLENDDG